MPQWVPSNAGVHGVDNSVVASTLWDPDGAGPLTERLVVAGSFGNAAYSLVNGWTVSAPGVAAYDFATGGWSGLGGISNVVAIRGASTGDLFAASGFNVFRWDGSSWQQLGSGMNGPVNAITVLPNGDLMAGGAFTNAGGTSTNGFARWNGSVWQNPGLGVAAVGHALTTLSNGHVLASGSFTVGGNSAEYVARWNGLFWTMLGTSMNGLVHSVTGLPNGDVVAAGDFTVVGAQGLNRVARWNGTSWQAMGTGMDATVLSVVTLPNGDVVASGSFSTAGGALTNRIARWDGTSWQRYREGMDATVRTLTVYGGGRIAVGGDFVHADGVEVHRVARWDGANWQTAGTGQPGLSGINAMVFLPNGNLVAAGSFDFGPNGVRRIARWDGTSWQALGSGFDGEVLALALMPNGDLVAGGNFSTAGGASAPFVARWDGTTWSAMGTGFNGAVNTLAATSTGGVVAGGNFSWPAAYVASWDGTTWQPLGSGMNGPVNAVVVLTAGDIVAGGAFSAAGGVSASYLARWDGSAWQPYPAGVSNTVYFLALGEGDDLFVGQLQLTWVGWPNYFAYNCNVSHWDGVVWQAVGGSISSLQPPYAMAALPNGDVMLGGDYTSIYGSYLVRSNGSSWSAASGSFSGTVRSLRTVGVTDLYVGGSFYGPASYHTDCPASLSQVGPGCSGSGGTPQTTVRPTPWVGLPVESRTTNLGASALAFALWGFSNPNVPLASLHPIGGPSCGLYANPDIALLLIPFAGEVTTSVTIPNTASFAGLVLYHQVVQFELDQNFNTIALNSGNGFRLVTGIF